MANLALRVEYDGSCFAGWQIQANAATVQSTIETALAKLSGCRIGITGAGRTDAGVHARGQVANCILPDSFSVPERKIAIAMNSLLPKSIRITGARFVPDEFHARYSASAREYVYRITTRESVFDRHFKTFYKYSFNFERIREAAEVFLGRHDFTSFSKHNESTLNYTCTVELCEWARTGDYNYSLTIRADRFVYGMVRALTGAMLEYQRGRTDVIALREALARPDRAKILPLAAPEGLTLEKVYYDAFGELFELF